MSDVVICATRAGEHSRIVHGRAFEEAKKNGADVVFVHVVGGPGFDDQSESMRRAILEEVEWLVRALVALAQQRTNADGTGVSVEIRQGETVPQILEAVRDHGAYQLVIGHPRNGSATTFQGAMLDDLIVDVAELGASVTTVEL